MRISAVLACLTTGIAACVLSEVKAETVQTAANVFNGRPFLWVEAEDFSSRADDSNNNGWKVVSKDTPITSVGNTPIPILPANSNVSGTALLDDIGGAGHEDTALYEIKFITAGTYQFYTRHSMYDSADADSAYGNEDSFYTSPAFNKNSSSDWIGFQGLDFDENDVSGNVDIPNPGFAADPDGFKPSTGDSANDGWTAIRDWGVKSMGSVSFPNNAANDDWNGHFNWYNRPFFVGANPAGGFASDFGFKTEYVVTTEMVGQTLTFEIGTREPYGVIDGFLFIQVENPYPMNDLLDLYTQEDLDEGILPQPIDGDYNNNGTVDAADYVLWRKNPGAFGGDPAGYNTWRTNFGRTSGSSAVLSGGAVPEPGAILLFLSGIAGFRTARPCRHD
jgi:hypothetical protein